MIYVLLLPFVKLNTDASILEDRRSACGRVVRDVEGKWIFGFCSHLNPYPTAIAEIKGITEGLEILFDILVTDK